LIRDRSRRSVHLNRIGSKLVVCTVSKFVYLVLKIGFRVSGGAPMHLWGLTELVRVRNRAKAVGHHNQGRIILLAE
jgi:hypothetical protein